MIWEGSLPNHLKIFDKSTRDEREQFIRNKYKDKLYLSDKLKHIDANGLLLKAAAAGKIYNIMQAIAAGADINTTVISGDVDTLTTPLHLAVQGGYILCIELLCINNANVDRRDANGDKPIDIARELDKQEMIDLLTFHSK
jgi:Arf-GAP with GTPase, ANK repeat and PH domain-containing protein 1/3/4/5/6/9/11